MGLRRPKVQIEFVKAGFTAGSGARQQVPSGMIDQTPNENFSLLAMGKNLGAGR